MQVTSTYSVKIKNYNHIFEATVQKYRSAVDYLVDVCLKEWDSISSFHHPHEKQRYIETLCHGTSRRIAKYDFDQKFYKYPAYLLRSSISEALGKVSSYKSNLKEWENSPIGKEPGIPKTGYIYPCLYRENTYKRTDKYNAQIKIWIRNTWDWLNIELKKSDVDYILRHCPNMRESSPTLRKRGKEWFLDFAFTQPAVLPEIPVDEQTILGVDLGINNACTCTAMRSDGTILGRKFLSLPREQDCLKRSFNRIRKAQQHGARKMPGLWASAKGINDRIAVLTAQFIIDTAVLYSANVIVMEHLDVRRKKRGNGKQRLHHWRAMYVQNMVTDKAHRIGIHIAHVNAWGTSHLAFDGSGRVERGINNNYSICRFTTGKIYNCDLNASYNIGARYFIREILREMPVTARLDIEAKVPQCTKRSTCTLSTLINLNAVLAA